MQDKEILQDMLTSEKQTISAYSTFITESSCPNLRNQLIENFKDAEKIQYEVFHAMEKKGWYPTKDANDSDVQTVKQGATKMMGNLK